MITIPFSVLNQMYLHRRPMIHLRHLQPKILVHRHQDMVVILTLIEGWVVDRLAEGQVVHLLDLREETWTRFCALR